MESKKVNTQMSFRKGRDNLAMSRKKNRLVSCSWADVSCRPPYSLFLSFCPCICEFPPVEHLDPGPDWSIILGRHGSRGRHKMTVGWRGMCRL